MQIPPAGFLPHTEVRQLTVFKQMPAAFNPSEARTFRVAGFAAMVSVVAMFAASSGRAGAQPTTFAGNAQHTAQYSAPAQHLDRVRWTTAIDLKNPGGSAHYGAPLITPANTVLVPVSTTNGFEVSAFEGASGRLKYTLITDYILPPANWVPVYQPVMAAPASGARLYYAGAGGTVYYIDTPDSDAPGSPVQQCFYTALTNYTTNAAGFNASVFINTPLTADTNGVIYFGFRVQATAPAPLSTSQSGYARIEPTGNASYVLAGAAAGDSGISRDSHNCAPALSNDGSTLYVAVKGPTAYYSYLLGLDRGTLTTKYRVLLRDPRNGNYAGVLDDSTASPTVGPDGDVFFGVMGNPNSGGRGFLLHFSADLRTQMPPSGFGWDYTAAIVPATMVPSYSGTSAYLLFSKYNNYAGNGGGDGINRVALLDPNATQIDPHPTAAGLVEMREVMTVMGCTPDREYQSATYPYAVREWCINTAAVDPATASVFTPSEDGHIYRWNLEVNSLTEALALGPGIGSPYVPTVIGPDGAIYTINGGQLLALGSLTNVGIVVCSSAPELPSLVVGEPVTFTAIVTNLDAVGPAPMGTITFQDLTYDGLEAITTTLAANVPLSNGLAAITTSTLRAGDGYLGSHFITAIYSGDDTFQTGSATLVQKVHASATTTTLNSWAPAPGSGEAVVLTAMVASSPAGAGTPSGMVSFWDGANFLTQVALNTNGTAAFTNSNLSGGSHAITAGYYSDTVFASSVGRLLATPPYLTGLSIVSNGALQLGFSNVSGAPFTVLGARDPSLPLSDWVALGLATEIFPGQFQFTDTQATNYSNRFYRV